MNIESKIENPICIRIGTTENVILSKDGNELNVPLNPGAMFDGDHYGFVLITDANGKQKERVYPTQCSINAVDIKSGVLRVFEVGKELPWTFNRSGKVEHSPFGEFTFEYRSELDIPKGMPMEEPILKNPLSIKISKNPEESIILKDETIKEDYPLYPGVVLETEHYGFILIIDTDEGQREVHYPTQNRIDAIGIEGNAFGDIKVFESGKYHPWLFSNDGEFKLEASFNPHSRKDRDFIEEVYSTDMEDAVNRFALKTRK